MRRERKPTTVRPRGRLVRRIDAVVVAFLGRREGSGGGVGALFEVEEF
jgi:hypothetical protein